MIQGLSNTRRRLIVIPIIAGIILLWLYIIVRVFINKENLELRGIIVKASITAVDLHYYASEQPARKYTIEYLYKFRIYTNVIQTSEYVFAKGDSMRIKIDSKDPGAYCELAY